MTTLLAWAGADQRGPASLYLASDSRITWGSASASWDRGRKLFAAQTQPHLFGYCGDAFFPTQILSQIADMIDGELICRSGQELNVCLKSIVDILEKSLDGYPISQLQDFSILHAMRVGNGLKCHFYLHEIRFAKKKIEAVRPIAMPQCSEVLTVTGSGAACFRTSMFAWSQSDVQKTSRAVFSAFCDALRDSGDSLSAPPPQLIGLYRIGAGRALGVIWDGKRYFNGIEVSGNANYKSVQWHNDLFEIANPVTMKREVHAQPQPRPLLK